MVRGCYWMSDAQWPRIEPLLPHGRRAPIPYNLEVYRSRNLVKRMGVEGPAPHRSRYDTLGRNFLAAAHIPATFAYWLN